MSPSKSRLNPLDILYARVDTLVMNTCDYYGNQGSNRSAGYCQNRATHDYGRHVRIVGAPYEVRFACDEHASRLNFYRFCKRAGHLHDWMIAS